MLERNVPVRWATVLAGLLGVTLTLGCATTETEALEPPPEDSCVFANDGVCDEPRNCALGSDSTDCDQACEHAYTPAIAAACDYDEPEPEPPLEDTGSHGSGGPGGTWDGTIQARGPSGPDERIDRYFRIYVPPSYDPEKSTPLLYVMGGFRVDSYELAAYSELPRLADMHTIILAYLQAHWLHYGSSGWVYQWYVFRHNWQPSEWPENPDLDFIRRLSDHLKGLYNIDRTRIYVSGHSRGAGLSTIVAFEAPELIAGFLSESGFTDVNSYDERIVELNPARKISAVLVHGTADRDVQISESDATRDALVAAGHVEGDHFLYFRLEGVPHQWQPQYNQQAWTFLSDRPLPLELAAP